MIGGDDVAQILGIEQRGECSRTDQVAKHHGQLAALGGGFPAFYRPFRRAFIAQRGNRGEQSAAMSNRTDADVPEIVGGQLREDRSVDLVVAKCLFVLLQSEAVEPRRNVHARLPDAILAAPGNLISICRHRLRISAAGRRQELRGA